MKATILRFARRALAYLIDALLVSFFIRPETFVRTWFGSLSTAWVMVLDFAALLLTSAYLVGSHWRWGRTLGKRIVGLRVATLAGFSPPEFRPAFVRYAPLFLLSVTLFFSSWFARSYWFIAVSSALIWLMADAIVALRTEGYRSLHDVIAGTVVTDEQAKKKMPNQTLEPTPISVTPAADAPVAPDTGAAHL